MPDPLKLLFIGNSQTSWHNLPFLFQSLVEAQSPGRRFEVSKATVNGASLEYHWNRPNTATTIRRKSWHFVILQETTWRPIRDLAKTEFFLSLFDAVIRSCGARTVLYAMWLPGRPAAEQVAIAEIYAKLTEGRDIALAPIATAVALSLEQRPDLSLDDSQHPTLIGSYLAASVLTSLFMGPNSNLIPCSRLVHGPTGRVLCDIAPDDAVYLTQIAQTATAACPSMTGLGNHPQIANPIAQPTPLGWR